MEQISTRYFKIFYTKLPHYVESENNLNRIPFCRSSVSCVRPV